MDKCFNYCIDIFYVCYGWFLSEAMILAVMNLIFVIE